MSELRCLQKALKRGQHADLKGHIELAGAEQLRDLLLNERHNQPLLRVGHGNGLVVLKDTSLPPLAPILVLGQLTAIHRYCRHATHQKPLCCLFLLLIGRITPLQVRERAAETEHVQLIP